MRFFISASWIVFASLSVTATAESFIEPPLGVPLVNYYNPFDVTVYDSPQASHKVDWKSAPNAVALVSLGPDGWYNQCVGTPGSCPTCVPYCEAGRQEFYNRGIGNPAPAPAPAPDPAPVVASATPDPALTPNPIEAALANLPTGTSIFGGGTGTSGSDSTTPSVADPYIALYELLMTSYYDRLNQGSSD